MSKKIPMRSCIITRERLEKSQLIRIVKTPEGQVKVDLSGKMNGRGAYIKKDINVLNAAKKNKVLNKHLEASIEDNIYDEIYEIINKQ